jgi:hypothetical protein
VHIDTGTVIGGAIFLIFLIFYIRIKYGEEGPAVVDDLFQAKTKSEVVSAVATLVVVILGIAGGALLSVRNWPAAAACFVAVAVSLLALRVLRVR